MNFDLFGQAFSSCTILYQNLTIWKLKHFLGIWEPLMRLYLLIFIYYSGTVGLEYYA